MINQTTEYNHIARICIDCARGWIKDRASRVRVKGANKKGIRRIYVSRPDNRSAFVTNKTITNDNIEDNGARMTHIL